MTLDLAQETKGITGILDFRKNFKIFTPKNTIKHSKKATHRVRANVCKSYYLTRNDMILRIHRELQNTPTKNK